ncbi:hypothetical protein HZA97_07420 [Candidatus Woesearchaeota archaeon]|nr:hypothetical protein [Candidatus Woesearchaeota archaeon]
MKKPIGTYVFGSLLLIFSLLFLWQNIIILRTLRLPTQFTYFEYFSASSLFIISILGIIGSIGLFLRKEWGRKTAIGVGCVMLILVTGLLVLAIFPFVEQTNSDKGLAVVMLLVTLSSFIITTLLFVPMLYFLRRPKVKEQFLQKTKIVKTKKK